MHADPKILLLTAAAVVAVAAIAYRSIVVARGPQGEQP
jgi:hypothetical protein